MVNLLYRIQYLNLELYRYLRAKLKFLQTQILVCKSEEHYLSFKFSKRKTKNSKLVSIYLKRTKKVKQLILAKEKAKKSDLKDNKKMITEEGNFLWTKVNLNQIILTMRNIFLKLKMNTLLMKSFNFSKWSMNALLKYKNKREMQSTMLLLKVVLFNLEIKSGHKLNQIQIKTNKNHKSQ